MRVISGEFKGMHLVAPVGQNTRPTADRIKEALFSILGSKMKFSGLRVLDVCAGTGSLGIEAISRGAESCIFIEKDKDALNVLRKNLTLCKCDSCFEVISVDADKALKQLGACKRQFDLIFFDPPYNSSLYETVPMLVSSGKLLDTGAIFVVERATRNMTSVTGKELVLMDTRTYGDTTLDFYTLEVT